MSTLLHIDGQIKLHDSALAQGRPDGNLHITVGTRKPARAQLSLTEVEMLHDELGMWIAAQRGLIA